MEILRLEPVRAVAGVVQVPGSKSLTNRVVLLAGIADGVTQVDNVLVADDTSRMLDALAHLGVETRRPPNATSLEIAGVGGPFRVRHADLFLGNAGTAMRPLTAMLTTGVGSFTLRGDPRMHERPIGPLVDALAALGAHIEYLAIAGYPPLRIDAAGLAGGEVHIDGSVSSQFTTALLLAAPFARDRSLIHTVNDPVSLPYVSMTIDAMNRFGVGVQCAGESSYLVEGGQTYRSPGRFYERMVAHADDLYDDHLEALSRMDDNYEGTGQGP
jgi:3-phosphoshikimate 1-carboxyvinyltransferase